MNPKHSPRQVSRRGRYQLIGVVVILAVSLAFASALGQSQTATGNAGVPTIISGSDIGFRVDERVGDVVAGTLVVRINGEWFATGPVRTLRPTPTLGK